VHALVHAILEKVTLICDMFVSYYEEVKFKRWIIKPCINLFDPQIRWKICYKHVFYSFLFSHLFNVNLKQLSNNIKSTPQFPFKKTLFDFIEFLMT
jgi:hypothetical protein